MQEPRRRGAYRPVLSCPGTRGRVMFGPRRTLCNQAVDRQGQPPPGEGGLSPDPEEPKLAAGGRDGPFVLEPLVACYWSGCVQVLRPFPLMTGQGNSLSCHHDDA